MPTFVFEVRDRRGAVAGLVADVGHVRVEAVVGVAHRVVEQARAGRVAGDFAGAVQEAGLHAFERRRGVAERIVHAGRAAVDFRAGGRGGGRVGGAAADRLVAAGEAADDGGRRAQAHVAEFAEVAGLVVDAAVLAARAGRAERRAQRAQGLAAEQRSALARAAGVDVEAAFEHEVGEVARTEVFGALEADAAAGLAAGGHQHLLRMAGQVLAVQVDDAVDGHAGLGEGGRSCQGKGDGAEVEFHGGSLEGIVNKGKDEPAATAVRTRSGGPTALSTERKLSKRRADTGEPALKLANASLMRMNLMSFAPFSPPSHSAGPGVTPN